jgi:hypothetical protein
MRRRPVILLLCAVALSGALACGGGGGSFTSQFADACTKGVNWDRSMCECMARRAESELSSTGREFLLATLGEDDTRTDKLRRELSVAEAFQVGVFMTQAGACAGG